MADFGEILGNNIRAERNRNTMTQTQLGTLIGLSKDRVSDLETNQVRLLADELPLLCRALGVPLEQLLIGADPEDLDALGLR